MIYTRFETFSSYTTIHDNNLRFYFLFLHAFQFLFQLFEEKFFKLKLEAVCCGNFVRQKKGKQMHDKLIDKFNDRLVFFFFFFRKSAFRSRQLAEQGAIFHSKRFIYHGFEFPSSIHLNQTYPSTLINVRSIAWIVKCSTGYENFPRHEWT